MRLFSINELFSFLRDQDSAYEDIDVIKDHIENDPQKIISKISNSEFYSKILLITKDNTNEALSSKVFKDKKALLKDITFQDARNKFLAKNSDTSFGVNEEDAELDYLYKDNFFYGFTNLNTSSKRELHYNEDYYQDYINNHLRAPKAFKTLKLATESDNLIIQGNNLSALHSLKASKKYNSYDLIYIDPPYYFKETKSEDAFNYNSNFAKSSWVSFMKSRLIEAKTLMNKEAIIFISTNEDGMPYLRIICDEIFGEKNFIENFIWNNTNTGKNNSTTTRTSHEYILSYAKSKTSISDRTYFRRKKRGADQAQLIFTSMKALNKTNREIEVALKAFYKNKDLDVHNFCNVDDIGIYKKDNISAPSSKNKKTYDVLHPITQQPCKLPSKGWGFTQESMQELLNQDRISFGEDHTTVPNKKNYLYAPLFYEDKTYNIVTSLIQDASQGKNDLLNLFDEAPFAFPKPVNLIKTLIAMHPKKDIKVLDFFAGSGTTGHAVMELNKEDGGTRSFTLVEQMDYAKDLTVARIQKAIDKYSYSEDYSFVKLAPTPEFELFAQNKDESFQNLDLLTKFFQESNLLFSFSTTPQTPQQFLEELVAQIAICKKDKIKFETFGDLGVSEYFNPASIYIKYYPEVTEDTDLSFTDEDKLFNEIFYENATTEV